MTEEKIHGGEDYKTLFNGKTYLQSLFSEMNPFIEEFTKFLHDGFSTDPTSGGRLLDFGSGPSIYHVISASRCYSSITCSDYTPDAYAQIQKWLSRDADAFDWTYMFQHVATLEGDRSKWTDLENRTRAAIKAVIPCDILQPEPLLSHQYEPFDCVLSTLCLEGACRTKQIYEEAVGKLASMLKPGGRLVMAGVLEETMYQVGHVKFHCLSLTRPDVEGAVKKAGLYIQAYRDVDNDPIYPGNRSGSFCVTCVKPN